MPSYRRYEKFCLQEQRKREQRKQKEKKNKKQTKKKRKKNSVNKTPKLGQCTRNMRQFTHWHVSATE